MSNRVGRSHLIRAMNTRANTCARTGAHTHTQIEEGRVGVFVEEKRFSFDDTGSEVLGEVSTEAVMAEESVSWKRRRGGANRRVKGRSLDFQAKGWKGRQGRRVRDGRLSYRVK